MMLEVLLACLQLVFVHFFGNPIMQVFLDEIVILFEHFRPMSESFDIMEKVFQMVFYFIPSYSTFLFHCVISSNLPSLP